MSEALKALNNIRTLRAHARETDLATLEEMLEKLTAIVEDRREEESAIRKEQEERQAKLEAFRQKLLDDGIDPAELLAAVGSSQPKAKSTGWHCMASICHWLPWARNAYGATCS